MGYGALTKASGDLQRATDRPDSPAYRSTTLEGGGRAAVMAVRPIRFGRVARAC